MKFANQVKININGGKIVENNPRNARFLANDEMLYDNTIEDTDIYNEEYIETDDKDIIENNEELTEESSDYDDAILDTEVESIDNDTNEGNNIIIYSNETDEEETLPIASKNITIKLNGNSGSISGQETKEINLTGIAEEWYSDKQLTKKVNSVEEIVENEIEEIYPKYEFPSIDLPSATKDGYIFTGWYTTETGGIKVASENYITTENITLYANFSEETEIEVTGITLNTENQDTRTVPMINMLKNETTTLTATVQPENASNKNYKFYSNNEEVVIDKKELTLKPGDIEKLTATIKPSDVPDKEVEWTSSNPNIVSIDQTGNITAIDNGTATITVTTLSGHYTDECIVVVKPIIKTIELDKNNIILSINETATIEAIITPEDAIDQNIVWSSDNDSIVRVDEYGNITANSSGTATISATSENGIITANCKVIVLKENEHKLTYIVDNDTYEEIYNINQEITLNKDITKKGHKLISWRDNDTSIEYNLDEKIIMGNNDLKLITNFELIIPDINETSDYKVYQNYISNIKSETNIIDLDFNISEDYDIVVFDKDNIKKDNNEIIVTGDKIQILLDEEVLKEYIVIIKGDITGDGKVSLVDFKKIYDYYKGKINLNNYYKEAADIIKETNTKNNKIRIDDIKKIYQYIIGKIDNLEE